MIPGSYSIRNDKAQSGRRRQRKSAMSTTVVIVKQGWLRGATLRSAIGSTYISFKGIPFAAPPVGNLRFKDPQPPVVWTGIRNAYEHGPKCAQFDVYAKKITGDDDCLYLNVATTSLKGSRPVMVYIHGGAFTSGSGNADMHSPDYLMESGIVFVSINYRLGAFGFLQVDREAAPGNMGLKDQVAALKWVKENIAQFGGDPNNITLFGMSAGGISIHYLMASPLAKGLFHKAIMQSGSATCIVTDVPESVEISRQLVAVLGRDITDPQEIVEYLRTVPAHELVKAQMKVASIANENLPMPSLVFGPTLDNNSVEPLLPKPFEELIVNGYDIPVIFGYNSHEAAPFLTRLGDDMYVKLDTDFEASLPRRFAAAAPSVRQEIARELREFYFGDARITKDSLENCVQYFGDQGFVLGIHEAVEIQLTKNSPTYFYKFSYNDPSSVAKVAFHTQAEGAIHTEELQYLFFQSLFREHIKMDPGSTKQILRDRFVRMWTDFAKTGNPTPSIDDLITEKWLPVTRLSKNYLDINADLRSSVNPDADKIETWKRVDAILRDQ